MRKYRPTPSSNASAQPLASRGLGPQMALSRHRDVPLGRQQLTQSRHRRTVKDGCDGRIILLECGTCTRLVISSLTTPSWPAPMRNFRSQELRNEVVAEQCLHRGFQRRPPFSAQLLRCHIGWKRSNKLIESGSWVLFLRIIQGSWPALPELSNPSHPCRRPAYAERQTPSSAFRQPSLPLSPGGQRRNSRPVRRPSRPSPDR